MNAENLTEENMQQFRAAQGEVSSALSRLLAVVESYPDLKASQNFLELQAQLEGTENRIAVERRKYNETVTQYNTYIKSFPPMLFAGIFGFREKPYFNAEPQAEKAPAVQF
jgi:LemA protein